MKGERNRRRRVELKMEYGDHVIGLLSRHYMGHVSCFSVHLFLLFFLSYFSLPFFLVVTLALTTCFPL